MQPPAATPPHPELLPCLRRLQKLRVGSSTFLSLDGGRIAANGIVSGASFQVHFLPRPCQPHELVARLASCAARARAVWPALCSCVLAVLLILLLLLPCLGALGPARGPR